MSRDTCHFCGTYTDDNGYESNGSRHWLSDCRPDLVVHEVGPLCTWPLMRYSTEEEPHRWSNERVDQFNAETNRPSCYAYQDRASGDWGTEHKHFWEDSPC